jgi:hypothetical protein
LGIASVVAGTGCAKQVSGSDPDNPTPGVVDDTAGLYVRYVANANYTYDLHKGATGFNTTCTATQDQSVDCFLDAEELDLCFHGVKLQYNVPSTLCTYVRFSSYFFLRYPVETSPTTVNMDTDRHGKICYDADSDGLCEVGEVDTPCAYDCTDVGGPNCCESEDTPIVRNWDSAQNVYSAPQTARLQ